LLFFIFTQDIGHADRGYKPSRRCQCPGGDLRWPVFR
jgi:hypothetical protein